MLTKANKIPCTEGYISPGEKVDFAEVRTRACCHTL